MGHLSVRTAARRVAIVALATVWPSMIVTATAAENAPLNIQVDSGALQGGAALGVENFLDIPYAAPPVGDLRWRPPQPPAHWSGTRPATERGTYCPQPKTVDSAQVVTDEDCLHLNVQRPLGTRADAKLPVYVYIHGGGFVTGSGMKDTPEKIVRAAGVVGVSVNYRLGALGFLALPGLEGGGTFGFLDQQAALDWVQHNIAAFGGDPQRVTVGGESAGGWSVCGHLVSARSRGLFAQAVIQSGACTSQPLAQAETAGVAVAHKLGCDDPASLAACLRAKSVAEVLGVQGGPYFLADGTPSFPQSLDAAVRAGSYAQVSTIIGTTRDEGRAFHQAAVGWTADQYTGWVHTTFGPNAAAVLAEYPVPADAASDPAAIAYQIGAIDTDSGELGGGAIERGIGGCGTAALTALLAQHAPVYAYEFALRDGPGWFTTPGYRWGAGHATELTYLYPMHDGGAVAAEFTPEESRTADAMARYWGAFTASGTPSAAGSPVWPDYADSQKWLSFGEGGKTDLISASGFATEHHCVFWDRLAGTPFPFR